MATAPDFEVPTAGGALAGWVSGEGPPVLLLHGGPGLSEYLGGLADELGAEFTVYRYQQRGLAPSLTEGPFDVETHVDDALAVLSGLGLDKVWLVGHSWGGHLVLHLAAMHPERFLGVLSVDPLGATGDGGEEELGVNLGARLLPELREQMETLDQRALAGQGTADDALVGLRLAWPGYFADPATAPPMPPDLAISVECYGQTFASIREHFAAKTLLAFLPEVTLPFAFLLGTHSPIPPVHGVRTAALIPGATVNQLDNCGHFIWIEQPGATLAALCQLVGSPH
jgi:pimeloyl-ACP methyl ester carboxylesterase